jgi:hypothetical protein
MKTPALTTKFCLCSFLWIKARRMKMKREAEVSKRSRWREERMKWFREKEEQDSSICFPFGSPVKTSAGNSQSLQKRLSMKHWQGKSSSYWSVSDMVSVECLFSSQNESTIGLASLPWRTNSRERKFSESAAQLWGKCAVLSELLWTELETTKYFSVSCDQNIVLRLFQRLCWNLKLSLQPQRVSKEHSGSPFQGYETNAGVKKKHVFPSWSSLWTHGNVCGILDHYSPENLSSYKKKGGRKNELFHDTGLSIMKNKRIDGQRTGVKQMSVHNMTKLKRDVWSRNRLKDRSKRLRLSAYQEID